MYSRKTEYFGIPVLGKGDRIDPDIEIERFQIIENQLLAGMKGLKCCVFEDGNYTLNQHTSTEFSVILQSTGPSPSARGIVNSGYFEGGPQILWPSLEKGYKYWLYITWMPRTYVDKRIFRAFSSTTEKDQSKGRFLLLASVDLKSKIPSVNVYPDGKIYADDIISHVADQTNPHGRKMFQDFLTVYKNMKFEIGDSTSPAIIVDDKRSGKYPTIESTREISLKDKRITLQISDDENPDLKTESNSLVGAINELSTNRIEIVDFETNGIIGTVVEIPSNLEVMAVTAHQRVVTSLKKNIGEIAIGYSQDGEVKDANKFKVFNSGDIGISMRAVVHCKG